MKRTVDSGTRWRLVVYKYDSDFPTGEDTNATRVIVEDGIVSLDINRDKSNPDGSCSVSFIGDVPSCIFIGNWVVIRSKIGAWQTKDDYLEGLPRMIGQICHVTTRYNKDETGNLRRQTVASIRKWSTVLQCPVRYDITSVANEFAQTTANTVGRVNSVINKGSVNKLQALAEQIFSPWSYAGVVLKFIGAMNASTEDSLVGALQSNLSAVFQGIEPFKDVALKMPSVPQELLKDLGLYDVEPNNAFASGKGFAETLLGVQTKGLTPKDYIDGVEPPNAFAGIFSSLDDLKDMYEITADRPIITNIGPEFTSGESAWNIMKSKVDPHITEMFTDIWYYENGNEIAARPVLVIRDKPFALKTLWKQMNTASKFSAKWTMLDDLPRVYVDDALIMNVVATSTFFNSPNYFMLRYADGAVARGYAQDIALMNSRVRLAKEMSRFGGIEHFSNTAFGIVDASTSPEDKGETKVNVKWYSDVAQMQYLWNGLNYRFLSGTMNLKDNNTPIMVGCNITWKMGVNILCAHVDSVSWQHSISMNGHKTTNCTIGFSYCCAVKKNGDLELLGPSAFNDLFEKQNIDTFSVPQVGMPDLSSFLDQIEAFRKAREMIDSIQSGLKKITSTLSRF